jgi:hypothetical protein
LFLDKEKKKINSIYLRGIGSIVQTLNSIISAPFLDLQLLKIKSKGNEKLRNAKREIQFEKNKQKFM